MGLAEQYELLELVHRDVATTWLAVEKGSKRRLLLHKFKEDTGLRDRLVSMAPNDLIMLVSAEKEGDAYLVVTHDVPALRQFREWVESRSAPPPKEAPAAGARGRVEAAFDPAATQVTPRKAFETPPAPTSQPGATQGVSQQAADEFTRMFESPAAGARSPFHEETVSGRPGASPPGEFTQMFGPPVAPAKPAPALRNEPNPATVDSPVLPDQLTTGPPTASPRAPEPGEFTRMFRPPSAAPGQPPPDLRNEPNPATVDRPVLQDQLTTGPPTASPRAPEPGEFTRMFQPPSAAPMQPPPVLRNEPNPAAVDRSVLPNEPTAPPASPTEPGEFTRMFRPAPAGVPVQPPEVLRNEPNLARPSSAESRTEPSEFTRMFQTPSAEKAAPAAPPAAKPASGPGGFTKIFSNPLPTTPLAEKLDALRPVGKETAPPRAASDFTRMFGQPQTPSIPGMAAPISAPSNAGATGIFSAPKVPGSGSVQPPAPVGPSEYTRMFGTPAAPPTPTEATPQAPKTEQKPESQLKIQSNTKFWPLVIVLAVLVIAAILLLVYVLKKH